MSVLFILLMYLVNGAQFLNITSLFLSSNCFAASSSPAPVIVIVPLTSTYASAYSHKSDPSIVVLNLISLLVYVPLDSSFISIQFPCSKFRWLIRCAVQKFCDFLVFHYYIIILTLIYQIFVVFIRDIGIFFNVNLNSSITYHFLVVALILQ